MEVANIGKAGWSRKPELADTAMGHATKSKKTQTAESEHKYAGNTSRPLSPGW